MTVTLVKMEACGFCGASGDDSCREFSVNVSDHNERFTELPPLFIYELDGITASTPEIAREMDYDDLTGFTGWSNYGGWVA